MPLAHAIVVCIMFCKCGLTRFFSNSNIPDENMFDEEYLFGYNNNNTIWCNIIIIMMLTIEK